MRKVYRLLGIPVWIVDFYDPETEVDPDDDVTEGADTFGALTATTQISDGNTPNFGFTPIDFGWDESED